VDRLSLDFVECSINTASTTVWRRSLAVDLSNSVLEDVSFSNVEYIITATNAPSSNETTNYQQLEFLGEPISIYSAECSALKQADAASIHAILEIVHHTVSNNVKLKKEIK
jgi:hypothetical protein